VSNFDQNISVLGRLSYYYVPFGAGPVIGVGDVGTSLRRQNFYLYIEAAYKTK